MAELVRNEKDDSDWVPCVFQCSQLFWCCKYYSWNIKEFCPLLNPVFDQPWWTLLCQEQWLSLMLSYPLWLSCEHCCKVAFFNFREEIPIDRMGPTPLCMFQFSRLFSCCKIPGKEKDSLRASFVTGRKIWPNVSIPYIYNWRGEWIKALKNGKVTSIKIPLSNLYNLLHV